MKAFRRNYNSLQSCSLQLFFLFSVCQLWICELCTRGSPIQLWPRQWKIGVNQLQHFWWCKSKKTKKKNWETSLWENATQIRKCCDKATSLQFRGRPLAFQKSWRGWSAEFRVDVAIFFPKKSFFFFEKHFFHKRNLSKSDDLWIWLIYDKTMNLKFDNVVMIYCKILKMNKSDEIVFWHDNWFINRKEVRLNAVKPAETIKLH